MIPPSKRPGASAPAPEYYAASLGYGPSSGGGDGHRRLWFFLRLHWWLPASTIALCLGAAAAFILTAPPSFVSQAKMWVTGKLQLPEGALYSEELQYFFATQIELLQSDRLQGLALERLRSANPRVIPLGPRGLPLPVAIRVSQTPKSAVFELEAKGPAPDYTRSYLNALMDAVLEYRRTMRNEAAAETLSTITERIHTQEKELQEAQARLVAFRREHNVSVLQEQSTIAGSYLARLNSQLADYRLEQQLLEATALEQGYVEQRGTNALVITPEDLKTPSTGASPARAPLELQSARKQVELLKIQRDQLAQFLRPKHPKMVRLNEEIERGEKLIAVFRAQNKQQLDSARDAVRLKIQTVASSIGEWESKLGAANTRIAEFERIRQEVDRLQGLFDRLSPIVQNVDMHRSIDQEALAILEPASPALRAGWTMKVASALLALMAGAFLGLVGVFALERFNDRLMSLEDIADRFDEEILGQLPELGQPKGNGRPELIQPDDSRHVFAESCRNIRSSLLFGFRPDAVLKTLLVTSAEPGEGKSTVAANLALVLAFAGARVLLVDADLRRSSIHRLFRTPREPGLGGLLRCHQDAERFSFIHPTSCPNLFVIPSGKPASNCGELVLSKTFDELMAVARRDFDYTIFDTIPVFASDDATTIAPKVDGVVFVVRSGFSRSRLVQRALGLLYQRQAKVLGLVLNRADSRSNSYPYYGYPEYHGRGEDAMPAEKA